MSDLRKAAEQALEALEKPTYDGFGEWLVAMRNARDALRAALAEPEQEPVAWAYVNSDGECEHIEYETPPDDPSITPLYAAPPQRQPLTDREIHDCFQQRSRDKTKERRLITRAIERAHGIGGKYER